MKQAARIRLVEARKRCQWTQQAVAEQLGTTQHNVSRWERGQTTPGSYFRAKLCELFNTSAQELGLLDEPPVEEQHLTQAPLLATPNPTPSSSDQSAPLWSVPYPHNPFFTGREAILQQLHEALCCDRTALLSQFYALSGLGGIGKTQIALEYAYRYARDYSAVFWISAETTESIIASFLSLTHLLNLPEPEERDQQRVVAAVTNWLNAHHHWLLIFDNVEDVELIKDFVPSARHGALLFTSRRQALGIAEQILDVEQMTVEEGMRFLLFRSRHLAPTASLASLAPQEEEAARVIVTAMGGLPLALDQAGAYIEETQCSLEDYLQLYHQCRSRLLDRRGSYAQDHPASVITTLSLTFRQVEQRNPVAAELLQLCAYLSPDAIPEELFARGFLRSDERLQALAGDHWLLDEAIAIMRTYSLIQRDPRIKTLRLHRLVQAVLQDRFSAQEQRAWVDRIIAALNHLFPEAEQGAVAHETWEQCERLVSHVLHLARQTAVWEPAEETLAALFFKAGVYLTERARYQEAEPLLRRALQMKVQVLGTEHVDVAVLLNQLGRLYCAQGAYAESEPLFKRALQIWEQVLGPEHPQVAETLNGLAIQYAERGNYTEAAPFVQRTLRIREQTLGADHLQVAEALNTLGCFYTYLANYTEAEAALQRAVQIREHLLGVEHPLVSQALTNLGRVYNEQGQHAEAEAVLQRALYQKEQALGVNHPGLTHTLNNLGFTYYKQGRYKEAEPLWKRVVEIWEQREGLNHPHIAYALTNLGGLYVKQRRDAEAEQVLRRARDIREHLLGVEHPQVSYPLVHLGELSLLRGHATEAESVLTQALRIREQSLGCEHPECVLPLTHLGKVYVEQGNYAQAEAVLKRAFQISEQSLEDRHPDRGAILYTLGDLYLQQGRYEEAEPLLKNSLRLAEETLGSEHPEAAFPLSYLAKLSVTQGRSEEAETLYKRALRMRKQRLGTDHPLTLETLHALESLHPARGKRKDASWSDRSYH